MNEQVFKLIEKALLASPADWETRAYLIDAYLEAGQPARAAELLKSAPEIPDTELDALRKAQVELNTDMSECQLTLEKILARNKACAKAYLLLAKVFQKRGLIEESAKKYGAATIIDETLTDAELEAWLKKDHTQPEPKQTPPNLQQGLQTVPPIHTSLAQASTSPEIIFESKSLKITFDDIGGMKGVIEQIRMNIIYPFKNPEIFKKFKKKPGGGILMYGPPGCGKTHIARATAGECGAHFLSIAITDILSKWLGESEQRLHQLFESARRHAPAVVFIDELDAIGMSRSNASSSMSPLVNVLLAEMDGISGKNENLMVLGATNAPWRVDDALRRPGRFDRVIFVPPPDGEAREAILKICLRDRPADDVNLRILSRMTERFSGADLRAVVDRASETAIYQEMLTSRATKLTEPMLLEAVKEMRPSTNEWLETARSYASYANRSGLYDDLVEFFENR